MSCEERERLLAIYRAATAEYSARVGEWKRLIGTSSKAEYHLIYDAVDQARQLAVETRRELLEHVAHHCGPEINLDFHERAG